MISSSVGKSMETPVPDEVLLGKAEIIERCLQRVNEEYSGHENELETNFTRQDSILLNIQRMCEAAIDAAMHLVRIHALGIPKDSREAFVLLVNAGHLDAQLGDHLQSMVGFRNIAVHQYTQIDMTIVRGILTERLSDMRSFAAFLIQQAMAQRPSDGGLPASAKMRKGLADEKIPGW